MASGRMQLDPSHWVIPESLHYQARERPEAVFLDSLDGGSDTYGQVLKIARRWAGLLRSAGLRNGDYVATMVSDPRESIHVWLGASLLRAIEAPIHGDYRGDYLAHALNTTAARAAVVDSAVLERFDEIHAELPHLEILLVLGDCHAASLPWKIIDARTAITEADPVDEGASARKHDTALVLMTSGTTGPSKGVLMPEAQLCAASNGAWPPGEMAPGEAFYSMLPLYHLAARAAVAATLRDGGRIILKRQFKTGEFWEDIRRSGATGTCLMGSMAGFLLDAPPCDMDRGHSLDRILMLPLTPRLDEFKARFGVRVRTIFSQTEVSSPIGTPGYDVVDYRSCGRPRPGVHCRIVDEFDEEVPPGAIGELVVRTDDPWTLMAGYVGRPDATAQAWRNLWLHTGDAFSRDEEGNYFFQGRIKDAIRRRGENVSCQELETSLSDHPEVLEAAVVGVPSEFDEEEIMAFVVRTEGSTLGPEELVEFLADRVPRFMVPRFIEMIPDLPRTPTAKVRKVELRERGAGADTWDRLAGASR